MSTEVFRFVTIRPPQDSADGIGSQTVINLELPQCRRFAR